MSPLARKVQHYFYFPIVIHHFISENRQKISDHCRIFVLDDFWNLLLWQSFLNYTCHAILALSGHLSK